MRGDGDEAMSEEADTKLMTNIINDQRKIIADVTGKKAEVAVIGKFQMWRNQEEGVAFIVNHFLGNVFSSLGISYAEVVYWRYVTFFGLNRLAL